MNQMFLHSTDWSTLAFRLGMAMLVGLLIGWNRQQGNRPAGIRTFMLVTIGSALFVMIPLQAEGDNSFASTNALSRTIQGVTTGVGFLGAGLILQQVPSKKNAQPKIQGLTTAASIWVAASLGAAVGCGLWQMGLLGAIATWFTLSGVQQVKHRVRVRLSRKQHRQRNVEERTVSPDE